jgi:tyrosinase
MNDFASGPDDPIFYLHAGYIDKLWNDWQLDDMENRLYQISGYTTTEGPQIPVTLDFFLPGTRVQVRDVMDNRGGYLCYRYSA